MWAIVFTIYSVTAGGSTYMSMFDSPPVWFADEQDCRTAEKNHNDSLKNGDHMNQDGSWHYTRAQCIKSEYLGGRWNSQEWTRNKQVVR